MIAIFAVDPGGSTGLAWGTFDETLPTMAEVLGRRLDSGSDTIEGSVEEQIPVIARIIREWRREKVKNNLMPLDRVQVVCEDFILRPGRHGGGKEGLSPVMISWGVWGYRLGRAYEYEETWGPADIPNWHWQHPTPVSTYATNARLRQWNAWVRGREHERSAWKHVAYRIAQVKKRSH